MNESHIFLAALGHPTPADRAAYLDAACAGDPRLRADVDALLRAHETDPEFLERPVDRDTTLDFPRPAGPGPAAVAARPGLVLADRYTLVEPIGEGGMGAVWRAGQTEPVRRAVAVKLIKAGMDSRSVLARFEAERQALAVMDHPNIAKVHDGGLTPEGRPFFVMELVDGAPVTRYCDDRRLTVRQRLELFVAVCQAVQHAHQKGVVHRDLKPSNVLVADVDGRPVPKVIDFGVAKATGPELTAESAHTGLGTLVGTPEYMSPEQASFDHPDVDTRSDVYALGVLLYELLAGSPPITRTGADGPGLLETFRVIREDEPARPSARLGAAAGLPALAARRGSDPARLSRLVRGDLDWIVMKCLEKDRSRRYESAAALAADVRRFLADEVVEARPPGAGYRVRKFVRRNKAGLLTTGAVAAVLLAATAVSTWQAYRATRAERASRLAAAELALDKGQLLGDHGEADLALLWLTRSLQLAPPDAADLRAAIRRSLAGWRDRVNSVRFAVPHDGWASGTAFAPDGTLLIVNRDPGSAGLTVERWDPAAGRVGVPRTIATESVWSTMAFSPTADRLLIGFVDGRVEVYDPAAGTPGRTIPLPRGGHATSATFSPDGKTVLIGSAAGEDGGLAQLFDPATGTPASPPLEHPRPVWAVAFRPDGKGFVTEAGHWGNATEKVEARFWDLDGRPTRAPLAHDCMAPAVAISPDGDRLLTGHWDFKARLWDLTGSAGPVVLGHDGPVVVVAFVDGGRTLLTASFDGTVRLWDRAGSPLGPPLRHSGLIQSTALDPAGGRLLVTVRTEQASRLWDLAAAGRGGAPAGPGARYFPLAFSPDRRTVLVRDVENVVRLTDAATGEPVGQALPHPRPVLAGAGVSLVSGQRHACTSDGRRAVTVDEDNVARLWDTTAGRPIPLTPPTPARRAICFAAAFSPDGRLVVTGTFDATARVFDAETGGWRRDLRHEDKGPVFNIAFSPDGRILATSGADGTARFWDPATGDPLGPPLRHSNGIMALAFGPDGGTLATGGTDMNVHLWDVAGRERRRRLSGHQAGVNVAAFSGDGRLLVTGGRDKTARLWDVATGKPVGPPMGHPDPVVRATFGPDDRTVLTATEDQLVREWPVPEAMPGTPEQLEVWAQVVTGMELEPDGGVQILDAAAWASRRDSLAGTGLVGPPGGRAASGRDSRP